MKIDLDILAGKKTYLAAFGLIGLAAWQASQGDYTAAVQSFFGALAAFGLRGAIDRTTPAPPKPPTPAVP